MAYDDFLIDKRVVERNMKKGLVDAEALKRQIDALPDRESNLVHVSLEGGAPAESAELSASEPSDADDEGDEDEGDEDGDEDDGDLDGDAPAGEPV